MEDIELDYTREELLAIDRAMHNLQRVAAIMDKKFGDTDGLTLQARATYALLMEQFAHHTTPEEFRELESILADEEAIFLKPMPTGKD
jgi:hypothetical protein